MNEIIYLEPDEEITSVIDRLKASKSMNVVLVIPRGSTLAQSIVNIKLLKRSVEEAGKKIGLITGEKVAKNLASQLGILVFSKVSDAEKATLAKKEIPAKPPQPVTGDEDFVVNEYKVDDEEDAVEEGLEEEIGEDPEGEDSEGEDLEDSGNDVEEEDLEDDKESEEEPEEEPEIEQKTKEDTRPLGADEENDDEEELRVVKKEANKGNNEPLKSGDDVKTPKSNKPRWKLPVAISSILIIVLVFAWLFVPYSEASIILKSEDISENFEIKGDKKVTESDVKALVIPIKLIENEMEITQQYEATGKKDIGEKAKGTLSFVNTSGVDDKISAGATIKSSGGVEFTLDSAITVPKATLNSAGDKVAGKINGKITAKLAGTGGNLPSSTTYTVIGKDKLNATGETAGGVTNEIKIVSENDRAKAETAINELLLSQIKEGLQQKVEEEKLQPIEIEDAEKEVLSIDFSKEALTEADNFEVSMKGRMYLLAFSEEKIRELCEQSLESTLGSDKMLINPEKANLNYKILNNDVKQGESRFEVEYSGKVGQKISEQEVKKIIANKSKASAISELKNNLKVEDAEIKTIPAFYSFVPLLKNRIRINFDYKK